MNGWRGKILRINLSTGVIGEESLNPKVAKDYIGGRGLGIYYLNKEVDPKCDPLSPDNLLIMGTGPLTGTMAPTGSRYMVTTKSPLTGALTCANAGGEFPTEMKRVGFDALLFEGCASEPMYLWIENSKAELRSAKHLWGKPTDETTNRLQEETDFDAKVACIGPAGENLVLFASIISDRGRAAGRSGVGAVMGSKKLKAVALRGEEGISVHDPLRFITFHKAVMEKFTEYYRVNPLLMKIYGTTKGILGKSRLSRLPTKNFQFSTFDIWKDGVHEEFHKKYFLRRKACIACPIGCTRVGEVKDPGYEGRGEGPEYETLFALGSNCMVSDLRAVIKANYLCNELGLDTITMGCTIACAMELVERGYLPEDEVGRTLRWGDGEALIELIRKTAFRESFGDLLAQGSYRLAERYGHPEFAMVSKKQEFAGYIPRVEKGMGLAYATAPTGASHMRGDPSYYEQFGIPVKMDEETYEGKASMVKGCQDNSCIMDAAGLCIFFAQRTLLDKTLESEPTPIMEYLNAATGAGYTIEELKRAGERIFNAERQFLVRAGFSRKDDALPPRESQEPLPDGAFKGGLCDLEEMLDEYYALRGWTTEGIPKDETLMALGLKPDRN